MVNRPILFSAPMVRALLDGRKTQTRRLLRNPEYYGCPTGDCPHETQAECNAAMGALDASETGYDVDDRLWVREAYFQRGHWEPVLGASTKSGRQKWAFVPTGLVQFDTPSEYRKGRHHKDPGTVAWHKRLGRFMPRAASRLTLTVTDVRVERLQAISEADAIAEGIEEVTRSVASRDPALRFWKRYRDGGWNSYVDTAVGSYASLWTEINGPGAWEANPWVVAVSFSVRRGNIDEVGHG